MTPAGLFAVSMYVVVDPGETVWLPEAGTAPIPGSILTESAPVTFQVRLEVCPGLIKAGAALKLVTTAGVA
jgi:hypothetical protein